MPRRYYGEDYGGNATENYERYFVPAIGQPLAEALVNTAALRPGERVLDVACGTGVVARLAAEKVGSAGTVVGLDLNAGMLNVARSATPPEMSIEWHEATAESIPLPDASVDVVLCQMGLQFMADKSAALREMHRVLRPGGRLIISTPGPTPTPMAIIKEALAHHVGTDVAQFLDVVFSLHDTGEIQNLIEGAGFHETSVQADTKSLRLPTAGKFLWEYLHSTPLAAGVEQVDDERRALLESEVVERCQEFETDQGLILQVRIAVATAKK